MKHSEGLEWAIHSCSLLAVMPADFPLPTRLLAEYFELPQPYLAKQLQKLSVAKIVVTKRGVRGGYVLARKPADITMLQIVEAIEGPKRHFKCTEIRRCGPTGVDDKYYPRPCGIARSMWRAETAWSRELAAVTLADIQTMALTETPPEQAIRTMNWFREKF